MTAPAHLAKIEARVARATPGPWKPFHGNRGVVRVSMEGSARVTEFIAEIFRGGRKTEEESFANADLIAHAPTDLLALIGALKEARAEIDAAVAAERERAASEADDEADDATERLKLPGANISALKATIRTAHRIAAAIRAGDGAREAERKEGRGDG